MDAMTDRPVPSVLTGMKRGVRHRCPNCGEGKLYSRYLKVEFDCEACGHHLAAYPADDGPAYFTILIVGHLFVAPLLLFPFIWQASPWLVAPLTILPLAALTLMLLPRVKGAVIGALWANGLRKAEDAPGG
ncbi:MULTISPECIES: DUF983 domain-containing protein [Caulobacter]|jgi:uncharacterized protein (DUF983 family)|uniref:DUF983 domain-containing protein n=2 Tax=Caulobacter TaxID=75 RepID=A0A2T9JDT6_9CAUL|nr:MULTISPECIES: DUF983 domain-containing protein [Caulobacter]MDG2529386.1 DUF983 domain-containing protein [Caulobacter endophyticus]PVM81048.1 hypothetical protein DDF65_14100 [Caulobacter radicis]PVM86147.1 hypothetical protein DDF62_18440 [Caulobacter radicis]PVM90033.1 hypothetical protein DDF67_10485 [Caulobacter endophyticus]